MNDLLAFVSPGDADAVYGWGFDLNEEFHIDVVKPSTAGSAPKVTSQIYSPVIING